jgi:hypothetical protein
MSDSEYTTVAHLKMRIDGAYWRAYLADSKTDEDVEIGSMVLRAAVENPAIRQQFIDLMRDVVSQATLDTFGAHPTFRQQQSPADE